MPQLDVYAFTPVISWLLVSIGIFYNILVATGVPRLYKILIYRKKKIENYKTNQAEKEKEELAEEKLKDRTLSTVIKILKFSQEVVYTGSEKIVELKKEMIINKLGVEKNCIHKTSINEREKKILQENLTNF